MKRRRTRSSGRLTRGLRKTGFHNDLRPRLVTTCGKWVTAPLFMQRTYELPCYNQSETGSILVPGYPFCYPSAWLCFHTDAQQAETPIDPSTSRYSTDTLQKDTPSKHPTNRRGLTRSAPSSRDGTAFAVQARC